MGERADAKTIVNTIAPLKKFNVVRWTGLYSTELLATCDSYPEATALADREAGNGTTAVFSDIGRRIYDGGVGPRSVNHRPVSVTKLVGLVDEPPARRGIYKRR